MDVLTDFGAFMGSASLPQLPGLLRIMRYNSALSFAKIELAK
jgi:hypothetical protein